MKYLLTITTFPFLLWFLSQQVPPGNDASQKILSGMKQWQDQHPQEKVFIQTDRDRYVAGEPLWLKGWCTLDNGPSYLSRILYVELTDAEGVVKDKRMFHLDSLSSIHGVMDLDRNLKSGNYSINAYTLWMLNFPSYIFHKDIFIYNTDYTPAKTKASEVKHSLTFFPEGGDMIEKVKGRVAFKATDPFGFPAEVKGGVFTSAGVKVSDIASEHDGMGVFELEPASGTAYVARVSIGGKNYEVRLPAARSEGVGLMVNNASPARIFVQVNTNNIAPEKYNRLFFIAHMNGTPVYKGDFNISEGETGAAIPKKNLPAGIMQVTVFDTLGNPLAERVAFISNHRVFAPELKAEKQSLARRGLNRYQFRLDSVTAPNLSVLVTDATLDRSKMYEDNIASSLLLTSDLKGYIHNPGYYFANKDQATSQHLDLLLMTQGWRRFNWKQIKGEETVALKYPVETLLNIRGKVTKTDRKEPVTSGNVAFIIKSDDSTTIMSNAALTDKGEFIVDSLRFNRKATVYYEGNNKKNSFPVDVTFYPARIDTLKRSAYRPLVNLDSASAPLDNLSAGMRTALGKLDTTSGKVLAGVTVRAKKVSRIDSLQRQYVSSIYENSDQTIEMPENPSFINIWQFLNQRVPGFNVNAFEPVTEVTFARNEGLNAISEDANSARTIQFILNEVPVDPAIIETVNPNDVALVKVYKGALAFPFGSDGGAIAIYTKKGVSLTSPYEKKFDKMVKAGFEISREFYSPDYTANPGLNKDGADERLTLYWNPRLKASADGTFSFQFHNNDGAKAYRVIVQGTDRNGNLVYRELTHR